MVPTMVSLTFVTIRKAAVVFTYWASVDGNKKHQAELGKDYRQPPPGR